MAERKTTNSTAKNTAKSTAKKNTTSTAKTPAKKATTNRAKQSTAKVDVGKTKAPAKTQSEIAKSAAEIIRQTQVKAVIMFACGILLGALVFIDGENLWLWAHQFINGMFGAWAVFWPLLLIYISVVTTLEKPIGGLGTKIGLASVLIILISSTAYIFSNLEQVAGLDFIEFIKWLYLTGTERTGAGVVGGLFGAPFVLAFGVIGARIVILILLFVSIMLLTKTTLLGLFKGVTKPVRVVSTKVQENIVQSQERREVRKLIKMSVQNEEVDDDIADIKNNIRSNVDEVQSSKKQDEKTKNKLDRLAKAMEMRNEFESNIAEDISKEIISKPIVSKEEQIKEVAKPKEDDKYFAPDVIKNAVAKHEADKAKHHTAVAVTSSVVMPINTSEEGLEKASKVAEEFIKQKEEQDKKSLATDAQMALYEDGKNQAHTYVFPPISFLTRAPKMASVLETEELQTNGVKLVDTLKSFGVQTKIVEICRGPSVTRYELQPAAGVKVSKITNLSKDLELNLAAVSVRIEAPIPGKAAVGVEIPNKHKSMVTMRELIESNEFGSSKSKLTVVLGKDIAGDVKVADLAKMPHTLIAGTTGSGKSVCINSLVISLIYKSSPDDVRFLMIDPKVVELGIYNGIPHLLVPVVTDPRKAAGALAWAVTEMLNRYKIFAEFNVKDLQGYNNLAKMNNYEDENGQPMLKMPQIVIIIDELADLMMAAPNEVEDSICRLAQMARAAGMHLVVATQRPTVDIVTGLIKANIPSRIAFAVSSAIDSRTILDSAGAEGLLGQGDMLYSPVGTPKPTRIQGCFVSESEIESVVKFIKSARAIEYDEKIIEDIEKKAIPETPKKDMGDNGNSETDPMLEDAIKCVIDAGQASTSLLQRKLRLGYARAGRLIDEMEIMGIVGPHEGSKPRQVLMSYGQLMERNMQRTQEYVQTALEEPVAEPEIIEPVDVYFDKSPTTENLINENDFIQKEE